MKKILAVILLSVFSITFGKVIDEKIVARIGDEVILKSELAEYLLGKDNVTKEEKLKILENIIKNKLIFKEALEDSELKASNDEIEKKVDAAIDNMEKKIGGPAAFRQALKANGLDINILRANYRERIKEEYYVQSYIMKKIRPNLVITDKECEDFYNEHKSMFVKPGRMTFLLFYKKYTLSDKDEQSKIKELNKIRTEILTHKFTFSQAAKKFSEGPSAEKGGDLGFVRKGTMVPEFEKIVFKLEPGEISEPFKTQFGYHIAYVSEIKDGVPHVFHIILLPGPAKEVYADFYAKFLELFKSKGFLALKKEANKEGFDTIPFNDVSGEKVNRILVNHINKMNNGSLSKPFYLNNGIVMIYLKEKGKSTMLSYVEVKSYIKNLLTSKKVSEEIDKLYKKLKEKYFVRIYL